jgi:hypothetical protein
LAWSVGRFFGHIWESVSADVGDRPAKAERRSDEERVEEVEGREVTFRRTTIEEVEVSPPRDGARKPTPNQREH